MEDFPRSSPDVKVLPQPAFDVSFDVGIRGRVVQGNGNFSFLFGVFVVSCVVAPPGGHRFDVIFFVCVLAVVRLLVAVVVVGVGRRSAFLWVRLFLLEREVVGS